MSSSAETATATLPAAEHRRMLARAAVAATIGTTIEWYDFFLYGTATGLVFGSLFFPHDNPGRECRMKDAATLGLSKYDAV